MADLNFTIVIRILLPYFQVDKACKQMLFIELVLVRER